MLGLRYLKRGLSDLERSLDQASCRPASVGVRLVELGLDLDCLGSRPARAHAPGLCEQKNSILQ